MEQTSPRAFGVSIHENRDQIRCLYHHGLDPSIGTKPLGVIRSLEPDSAYEVDLFDDADYVQGLLPGLRANQYGASFRCKVIRDEIEPKPARSSWNPNGIPQVKLVEADLVEFGPTPFPQYKGTAAAVRAETSLPVLRETHCTSDLEPDEHWVTRAKPFCPGVIERQRVRGSELASWEGRRDEEPWWYLSETRDAREWLLA